MSQKWNYVEFVFYTSQLANSVNIDMGEFAFLQLLATFSKDTKMFSKNITRYFYGDLIYEVCNKEIKTFKKTTINCKIEKANTKLFYFKEKIPFYLFPSTQDIHEMQNISSAIFRIHNNIYMNFDIITYPQNNTRTYKVYLNYNHEPNIDIDHIKQILLDLQTQISSTGLHFPNFLL